MTNPTESSHGVAIHAMEQACVEYFSSSTLIGMIANDAIMTPVMTMIRKLG